MITKDHICSICYDHIISKWNSLPEEFPDFLPIYTTKEKADNESLLSSLIPEFRNNMITYHEQPSKELENHIKNKIHHVIDIENIIHIKEHISKELFSDFELNLELFLKKTKDFDETLSQENIWQSMRNYLIYCMIVNLQGEKQNCRDTILGYSLLYPYTDNYIDKLHRKTTDKNSYNQLIRKTLMGENMIPTNFYEEKTKRKRKVIRYKFSLQSEASSLS